MNGAAKVEEPLIHLALPKGHMQENVFKLLEEAGMKVSRRNTGKAARMRTSLPPPVSFFPTALSERIFHSPRSFSRTDAPPCRFLWATPAGTGRLSPVPTTTSSSSRCVRGRGV